MSPFLLMILCHIFVYIYFERWYNMFEALCRRLIMRSQTVCLFVLAFAGLVIFMLSLARVLPTAVMPLLIIVLGVALISNLVSRR